MKVKQGDTFPKLTADMNADVSGATVRARVRNAASGVSVLDSAATVTDPVQGLVELTLPNTLPIGAYQAEFMVTFSGGAVQRFPQGSWLEILVLPSTGVPV